MTITNPEPVEVAQPDILERIYILRAEVWQHEGAPAESFPSGRWTDDYDQRAVHWAIFHGDEIVAAARLTIHRAKKDLPDAGICDLSDFTPPVASFNRLVVHPASRALGLASSLDRVRLARARSLDCTAIYLFTPVEARISALRRRGFVSVGYYTHPFAGNSTVMRLSL